MIPLKNRKIPLILFLFVFVPCLGSTQMVWPEIEKKEAVVTVLEGQASLVEGMTDARLLAPDHFLAAGDCVRTGKNSRIEVRLPDESRIRFDELATFKLFSVNFDKRTGRRSIKIRLVTGKGWFNVPKTTGRFEVLTRTASMSMNGTVFRVDVDDDEAVVVKVYRGKVEGSGFSGPVEGLEVEKTVHRPEESGPRIVSSSGDSGNNWTYSIEAMRQMVVHPEGKATKPFRFSAKSDLNSWVRWNQQLDEML